MAQNNEPLQSELLNCPLPITSQVVLSAEAVNPVLHVAQWVSSSHVSQLVTPAHAEIRQYKV